MSIYHQPRGSVYLKIIIVILIGILVYVIYEPYQIREQEEGYKRESRARMVNIRTAQLQHISDYGKYAPSIDTLVAYVKQKIASGAMSEMNFKPLSYGPFVPESLLHAPKSLRPYVITAIDTTIIKKYLLVDPDGYGSVGSLIDDARINKASWEE